MLNGYTRRFVATIRDHVEVRNATNAMPFETASAMAPGSTPSRILAADGDSSDAIPMMFDHTVLDCNRFLICSSQASLRERVSAVVAVMKTRRTFAGFAT